MPDITVFPVAQTLLTCLTEALGTNPSPPQNYCLRTGDVVFADFNQNRDECCEGLAYVRVARIFPSDDEFPVEQATWRPCHPLAWAAELEMGVWRCEPQQTPTELPSCEEWTSITQIVLNDWEAMTRAMCCLTSSDILDRGDPVFAGTWAPLNSGGGCTGGAMPVIVGRRACSC